MGYKYQKEDILQIGYDTFRKKGYHNVGINEILKNANIPKGSFYNFFKSKEDFALQTIEYYSGITRNLIIKHLSDKSKSPYNRIKHFYSFMINLNENDNFSSGCLLNNMANELGTLSEPLSNATDKNFLSWIYLIADCIKEAQLLGEVRDDYTSFELAEYLHAGLNGTFSRMKVTNSRTYMDKWLQMSFEFIKN